MNLVSIRQEGRIATVSFDTGSKANALSQELMRELTQAAGQFQAAKASKPSSRSAILILPATN